MEQWKVTTFHELTGAFPNPTYFDTHEDAQTWVDEEQAWDERHGQTGYSYTIEEVV